MRDKFSISFIYITHDLVTARYLCDRLAIMYLGKIVEIGPTEKIVHNPRHPYTRALISAVPDPDPTAELPALPIKGYVPMTQDDTFNGCNFYLRCPCSTNSCRDQYPRMQQIADGHQVACFQVDT
jgi:peptide/nickel transport system ATP-binding protein